MPPKDQSVYPNDVYSDVIGNVDALNAADDALSGLPDGCLLVVISDQTDSLLLHISPKQLRCERCPETELSRCQGEVDRSNGATLTFETSEAFRFAF